jgi:hypothetical protein
MAGLRGISSASVGVFAWVRGDGSAGSCAVTPYVVNDDVVITSTLAFTSKASAVRRDPRVALLAGGQLAIGSATIFVDQTPRWFDDNIRSAEIRKFPPTKSILSIPGHRRLFPWYVGRIVIRFRPDVVESCAGSDRITASWLADGRLRILPITVDETGNPLVADLEDGPVQVLVHEEHNHMADLRQLSVRGQIDHGQFVEVHRSGSMDPSQSGIMAQIAQLRSLARLARRSRAVIESWG